MRLALLALLGCTPAAMPEQPGYAEHVQPVLETHCVRCHTSEGRRDGGVELDRFASARSTRVSAVCTAIEPEVATLYGDALASAADPDATPCGPFLAMSMPPGAIERLSLYEQELIARWVATGATP